MTDSHTGTVEDVGALEREIEHASTAREKLVAEYQLATARKDVVQIEHLKSRLVPVNKRLKELRRQLHERESVDLDEAFNELRAEVATARKAFKQTAGELRSRVVRLESELNTVRRRLDALESRKVGHG